MFTYENSDPDLSMLLGFEAVRATCARTKRLANDVEIYYKEAVLRKSDAMCDESNVLLLHDFLTSSNYFRNMLPLLAAHGYRVLAPDLPGFGVTQCPKNNFTFSLQKISETIVLFIDSLDITGPLVLYCHGEYGTLVGLRVAQYKLESIAGIIVQNGSAFLKNNQKPGLFDMFNLGESQLDVRISGGFLSGTLSESDQSKHRSCLSSRSNSYSNSGELEHKINHQKRGSIASRSRVSFGHAVEEINTYEDGAILTRTKSNAIDSDSDDSNDSNTDKNHIQDIKYDYPIKKSPEIITTILTNDNFFSSNDGNSNGLTVDQLKSIYASEASRFSDSCKRPDFSHNYQHTLDMQAVLLDYYFLSRPEQLYIQKQLYKDYLHQITHPATSISMWLRTTNTPLLLLWGTNDSLLSQDSTLEAFKRDCRFFSSHTFDCGGHFAVEYYSDEISMCVHNFIQKNSSEKRW